MFTDSISSPPLSYRRRAQGMLFAVVFVLWVAAPALAADSGRITHLVKQRTVRAGDIFEIWAVVRNTSMTPWKAGAWAVQVKFFAASGRMIKKSESQAVEEALAPGEEIEVLTLELKINERIPPGDYYFRIYLKMNGRILAKSKIGKSGRRGLLRVVAAAPGRKKAARPKPAPAGRKEAARPTPVPAAAKDLEYHGAEYLEWFLPRYDRKTMLAMNWKHANDPEFHWRLRRAQAARKKSRRRRRRFQPYFGISNIHTIHEDGRFDDRTSSSTSGESFGIWFNKIAIGYEMSKLKSERNEGYTRRTEYLDTDLLTIRYRFPYRMGYPYVGFGRATLNRLIYENTRVYEGSGWYEVSNNSSSRSRVGLFLLGAAFAPEGRHFAIFAEIRTFSYEIKWQIVTGAQIIF